MCRTRLYKDAYSFHVLLQRTERESFVARLLHAFHEPLWVEIRPLDFVSSTPRVGKEKKLVKCNIELKKTCWRTYDMLN